MQLTCAAVVLMAATGTLLPHPPVPHPPVPHPPMSQMPYPPMPHPPMPHPPMPHPPQHPPMPHPPMPNPLPSTFEFVDPNYTGFRFAGQQTVIFGGTSGIGFATAGRFIQECAVRTVIVGRNEKKGHLAVQVLKQQASQQHCVDKGDVEYMKADITNRAQVRSVLDSFHNTHGGRLQVVVQAAATIGYSGNFANLPDEILFTGRDAVYNNLYGTKTVTQEALRFWGKDKCTPLQQKECPDLGYVPSLTLLSSLNGMTPTALGESYGQSKHGIINIATSVGASYPGELRVNAILPGLISTPFTWNQARNVELQPDGTLSGFNNDMQTSWQCTVDGKFIEDGDCPGGGTGYGCPCEDLFKDDPRVEALLVASNITDMIDPRRVGDAILEIADAKSTVTSASKVVDEQIFQCVNELGGKTATEPLWTFCPLVQMDAHEVTWAV